MTQDEIVEMAREAGLPAKHPDWIKAYLEFAKLVAAKEREACAKLCEQVAKPYQAAGASVALECASIIRARG
jgi:hypothetical protein